MRKVLFICLLVCCSLYSCVKAPDYPIVPHIEFKSVSANLVRTGEKDTITFSFTDGDGDIGGNANGTDNSDYCGLQHGDSTILRSKVFNVFLIDSRSNCVQFFASADVEPGGRYKDISGDILVIAAMSSSKCIIPAADCPDDSVTYNILLTDKAGHFSNIVPTSLITISGKP